MMRKKNAREHPVKKTINNMFEWDHVHGRRGGLSALATTTKRERGQRMSTVDRGGAESGGMGDTNGRKHE